MEPLNSWMAIPGEFTDGLAKFDCFQTFEYPIHSSIQSLAESLNQYYSTKAASERFKTFNRNSIALHAISLDGISKFYDSEELEAKTEGQSEYIFTQYVPVKITSAEELLSKKSEIENALEDWLNCSSEISVTENPVIIDYIKASFQIPNFSRRF